MTTTDTQLVHFDAARRELELATKIDEVKVIRDQAEVMRQYIKQQDGSLEMQNQAAAIKLRAERKLGKMFKDIQRMPGERTDLDSTSMHDAMGLIQPLTYTEIEICWRRGLRLYFSEPKQNELKTAGFVEFSKGWGCACATCADRLKEVKSKCN